MNYRMPLGAGETLVEAGSGWTYGGYSGRGNVAALLGSEAGRPALICGTARGVFDDMAAANERIEEPLILAVNEFGLFSNEAHAWISLHVNHLEAWQPVRYHNRLPPLPIHGPAPHRTITWAWDAMEPVRFGLSGYFALQVAYLMGCEPIILCGCPGSPAPRFYERDSRPDFGYGTGDSQNDEGIRHQLEREMTRLSEFKSRVRSQSGWTRDYFGGLET